MSMMPAANDHPEAPLFSDGLGDRAVTADGATGELLQVLHLKASLTSVPSFEFALRERSARLANFRHAYYARVRRIDRTTTPSGACDCLGPHRGHSSVGAAARCAGARADARHQRGALPDTSARTGGHASARKRARRGARPDRAGTHCRHAAGTPCHRGARARRRRRAAAVRPRSPLAGIPGGHACHRRPSQVRSSFGRRGYRSRGTVARARTSACR